MAEIPVDHKPVMPVWAGLLGLLALVILIWVLFSLGSNARNDTEATDSDIETAVIVTIAPKSAHTIFYPGAIKADVLLPT